MLVPLEQPVGHGDHRGGVQVRLEEELADLVEHLLVGCCRLALVVPRQLAVEDLLAPARAVLLVDVVAQPKGVVDVEEVEEHLLELHIAGAQVVQLAITWKSKIFKQKLPTPRWCKQLPPTPSSSYCNMISKNLQYTSG